ncbi:MAG: glucuronate isomerase [Micrococcales bacterium]
MSDRAQILGTRLMPSNQAESDIAAQIYKSVANLPIISPHGHVDPNLLLKNEPFADPATLFVFHDHYVTRLLHADGVAMEALRPGADPRFAWRELCSRWHLFLGTSSGYWLAAELLEMFGIDETPSASNADELFDRIAAKLTDPEFLPRALFAKFNISMLATTDDPCDDLEAHRLLAEEPNFGGRVVPTFRPDAYTNALAPAWPEHVARILAKVGRKSNPTLEDFLEALAERRAFFRANGAISTDHGVVEPYTVELSRARASDLFNLAMNGAAGPSELRELSGYLLFEMFRAAAEDGLVMTVHAGVYRNHSGQTFEAFGPDTGHDIPIRAEFTNNLRPAFEKFGLNSKLHVILFALDETTWAREIAPLAGFYPSVFVGAPWWFLDAPDAAMRFRDAITDSVGFYRGSGFIDDTRAFLSIPARHDMARRIDSAYLAKLVVQQRLTIEQAKQIAHDLVVAVPKRAFKL